MRLTSASEGREDTPQRLTPCPDNAWMELKGLWVEGKICGVKGRNE
jgi:hypothetical protein